MFAQPPLHVKRLKRGVAAFRERLREVKAMGPPSPHTTWFGYDSLGNVEVFAALLRGEFADLGRFTSGRVVADIGAADGDLALYLAECGMQVQVIDHAPTNWNNMEGVRALVERTGIGVEVFDRDVDAFEQLPCADYGLVLFLGLLYHLRNPYGVLERLARCTQHMLFSTKVAQHLPPRLADIEYGQYPLAYLLGERECNNDDTNYFVFGEVGLRRLLERTGWEVCAWRFLGHAQSNPADVDRDARVYALLRSRHA